MYEAVYSLINAYTHSTRLSLWLILLYSGICPCREMACVSPPPPFGHLKRSNPADPQIRQFDLALKTKIFKSYASREEEERDEGSQFLYSELDIFSTSKTMSL